MLLPREIEIVAVEHPKGWIPHRVARQAYLDMVAAALPGPPDQRSRHSHRSQITGDEVVHDRRRRKLRPVGRPLQEGKATYAKGLHVESAAVGPRPVISVAADRAIDGPGPAVRQLLRREAQIAHAPTSVAIDEHIGTRSQIMSTLITLGRLEVDPGGPHSDARVRGEHFMLELLRMLNVQYFGPLLGKSSGDSISGEHVRR